MTDLFGRYARYYDAIYQDKDYEGECDAVEAAIATALGPGPKRVLDLGCGTASHAVVLACRGHLVTGVDRSEAMLDVARAKVAGGDVRLLAGDLRSVDLGETFDVVTCLFAALSYQLATEDVLAALRTFRRHLDPGGLVVFDYWSGPAVLSVRPSPLVRTARAGGLRIVRAAAPVATDVVAQTHTTEYHVSVYDGERLVDEVVERHRVRFLFPQEIVHYGRDCGLDVISLTGGWQPNASLTEDSWVGVIMARAC